MWSSSRALARSRTQALINQAVEVPQFLFSHEHSEKAERRHHRTNSSFLDLNKRIIYAGYKFSPLAFLLGCLAVGFSVAALLSLFVHWAFVPFVFLFSSYLPVHWLSYRAEQRAGEFATDYPSTLLATAASIQVGLTPLLALERSTRLLPSDNPVCREVSKLLEALRSGLPKQLAMNQFAHDISLPELELFRSAFLLVLENGGRFSPTLNRLAQVSADRVTLIKSARVSTANMRMTANVLLAISPFIVLTIAARTADFWNIVSNNPTANFLFCLGSGTITVGYLTLRRMSAFKP